MKVLYNIDLFSAVRLALLLLIFGITFSKIHAQHEGYNLRDIKNVDELFSKEYILNQISKTADWQLAHMPEKSWLASSNSFEKIEGNGWIRSAFYTGVMAAYNTTKNKKYLNNIYEWGNENNWKPAERPRHADDHCAIQTYVDIYLIDKDENKIKPAVSAFDIIAADPMLGSVVGWEKELNWNWCDALFMAPPAMVRLSVATGETKHLETMDLMYWDTYEYLFDKNEYLFYRDARFKPDADPLLLSENGSPIFWSRGNGWVIAGLARILEFMPDDFKNKNKYEKLFTGMSAKLITLQDDEGFWHSNLLDPVETPEPESSGTAFFCYGIAWGINNGYLDKTTFLPVVKKAWIALNKCLDENGQLHWVQLVGSAPAPVKYENSVEYATGAFILAGSEVIKLID